MKQEMMTVGQMEIQSSPGSPSLPRLPRFPGGPEREKEAVLSVIYPFHVYTLLEYTLQGRGTFYSQYQFFYYYFAHHYS